ncbi:hypothetical protein ACFU5I_34235, partial [Streptomyces libani]|uniref:hypothetical protein n=1 Tax=Streptomyces nigrescens TaxID=1920 RepID=UPI00369A6BE3
PRIVRARDTRLLNCPGSSVNPLKTWRLLRDLAEATSFWEAGDGPWGQGAARLGDERGEGHAALRLELLIGVVAEDSGFQAAPVRSSRSGTGECRERDVTSVRGMNSRTARMR